MTREAGQPSAGPASPGVTANLVEIFSSVQGEGPEVGLASLFVRFGECDLRCRWCDSPHTWQRAASCRIEVARGSGRFASVPNPVGVERIVTAAEALNAPAHELVCLTGGEPLLQPVAVREVARALRAVGPRVLLETHGLACEALEAVIAHVDVVSMDWKLASDVRRASDPRHGAVRPFHAEHQQFLKLASRAPAVVVKLVVTNDTRDAEIDEAARSVAATAPGATLVLQPVTPHGPVREVPSAERLLALHARVAEWVPRVRLIPQTHKSYGAL